MTFEMKLERTKVVAGYRGNCFSNYAVLKQLNLTPTIKTLRVLTLTNSNSEVVNVGDGSESSHLL